MEKKKDGGLDRLFGSKSRVKLLNLFLNNPQKSFYVREITRLVNEQINSIRRELSNLQELGVVENETYDNKLFYKIDETYVYYDALKTIFASNENKASNNPVNVKWLSDIKPVKQLISALLVIDSPNLDILVIGDDNSGKLSKWAHQIEKSRGKPLNYAIISKEDYYYRISAKDNFLVNILREDYTVIADRENIFKEKEENV